MYINNVIIRKIEFYITRNVVCYDCSYIVSATASIEPHRLLGYIYIGNIARTTLRLRLGIHYIPLTYVPNIVPLLST